MLVFQQLHKFVKYSIKSRNCYSFIREKKIILHSWLPVLRSNYNIMPSSEISGVLPYFAMFAPVVPEQYNFITFVDLLILSQTGNFE